TVIASAETITTALGYTRRQARHPPATATMATAPASMARSDGSRLMAVVMANTAPVNPTASTTSKAVGRGRRDSSSGGTVPRLRAAPVAPHRPHDVLVATS